MRRLFVLTVVVLGFSLAAAAMVVAQDASPEADEEVHCPGGSASPEASPMAVATVATMGSPEASPAAGAECETDIVDFAFEPQTIAIDAGTTVTWENYDTAPHTVTSDTGDFDSGNLEQDQTFSHTFDAAGTFAYHCDVHPNMTGSVVVQ